MSSGLSLGAADRRRLLRAVVACTALVLVLLLLPAALLPWAMARVLLVLLAALGLGSLLALLSVLRRGLWQPLAKVVEALPRQAAHQVDLVPEQGMAPVQTLGYRINLLLEQVNTNSAARERLLNGLLHDLRGPLTRLLLRVEDLQEDGLVEAEQLGAMQTDLGALQELGNQLAALSETIPERPEKQRLSLDDYCRRIADSYGGQRVSVRMPRVIVDVERELLQRALNNLIDNALEYGRPPIWISVSDAERYLVIHVDDHGDGPASFDQLALAPIQRAEDRGQMHHRGLGLSIVESFCRRHGGQMHLSRSPQGGLRVDLQLARECLVSLVERRSRAR